MGNSERKGRRLFLDGVGLEGAGHRVDNHMKTGGQKKSFFHPFESFNFLPYGMKKLTFTDVK